MKQITIIALLFVGANTYAQTFEKGKMDSLFQIITVSQKGMGSLSLFENGKEVYQKTIGYLNVKEGIVANSETKYRIGSISKTFTASIILRLVEERKLKFDTKLSEYFPEIKNADHITIELLLRHRSGLFNFTNAADYESWMEQHISKKELVDKIVAYGNVFEPDARAEYSNTNYVLLSYIAEKTEGKEYSAILNQRICKPCALQNTYFGSKISISKNEALSYTRLNDWSISTETNMNVPVGAGGIVSNPTDLNKFLHCLFTYKVISEESLKTMMNLQDGFGMGLFQVPFYTKRAYGHTGGIDGFQSNAFYFPPEKVSVSYTTNGVVMPVNDILIGVLSIYFGKEYELPTFKEPLKLSPEDLDKYLGVYASPTFPLKITITKKENILIAQATGQPSFPLEAYAVDKFKFDQAKLKLEFIPTENKMILRQGAGEYELKKE